MDWMLSVVTVLANYLIGRKNKWGWIVMLILNGMWIGYAIHLNPPQYGLLPAIAANCVISIINARKWFMDEVYDTELRNRADERTTIK